MRIDEIEIRRAVMPLEETWSISVADRESVETVLLRVTSAGKEAWAETTPGALPYYSPDWAGATFFLLREVAPQILGGDTTTPEALNAELSKIRGNQFARAGIDAAWWALEAQLRGEPLYRALGATRDVATVGADFGVLTEVEDLLDRIERAVDVGYRRFKLKVRHGWCLDVLEAVRARFPAITLHVDCNGAFTMADLDLLQAIDRFELMMIEQPLAYDDLVEHARLQERLATPICLDESVASLRQLDQAIALGSCRALNVKPGRVGGLTVAREMIARSHAAGLRTWVGGMLESAIGAASCLALACLDGVTYPSDIFPSDRFYARDLGEPSLRFSNDPQDGRVVHADPGPGVRQRPDPALLDAYTVETATFQPRRGGSDSSRPTEE